jgi:hypothetical protein
LQLALPDPNVFVVTSDIVGADDPETVGVGVLIVPLLLATAVTTYVVPDDMLKLLVVRDVVPVPLATLAAVTWMLLREKLGGDVTPDALVVTLYEPVVALAVNVDAVAWPLALVVPTHW